MSRDEAHVLIAVKPNSPTTNNVTENEACLLGLEAPITFGVEERSLWKLRSENPTIFEEMENQRRKEIEFHDVPRTKN